MRLIDEVDLLPAWVDASQKVQEAIRLMRTFGIRAIPIKSNGDFLGLVSFEKALAESPDAEVGSLAQKSARVLSPDMHVRDVAELFAREGLDLAPVVEEGEYLGLVRASTLLGELRRAWDPLTSLFWGDHLREWGIKRLAEGKEISILFSDVDDFGSFNKEYGHIVGDRVLLEVTKTIREMIDPDRDLLVRYGGDEFAIGSTRDYDSAAQLRDELEDQCCSISLEGIDRDVSVTIGVSGGKRDFVRERAHLSATLDDLITIASKDATSRKLAQGKTEAEPSYGIPFEPAMATLRSPSRETQPTTRPEATGEKKEDSRTQKEIKQPEASQTSSSQFIEGEHGDVEFRVELDSQRPDPIVVVVLRQDGDLKTGVAQGRDKPLYVAVAEAVANGLQMFPALASLRVERLFQHGNEDQLVTVVMRLGTEKEPVYAGGSAALDDGIHVATVRACLRAAAQLYPELF